MKTDKAPFAMSKKIRLLLNKKELELMHRSSIEKMKLHSPHRLRQYIKLARSLRDKYRDLTQRQKAAQKNTESLRTIQKAKVFQRLLFMYEKQDEKMKTKLAAQEAKLAARGAKQARLDHEEHYDIDGVTFEKGQVKIPSENQTVQMKTSKARTT